MGLQVGRLALMTSAGPIIQPTRQPVMAYVLATPLRMTTLSASSGTAVGDRRCKGTPVVGQVLINLVGHHPQALRGGPLGDRSGLLERVDSAGRVGGRNEDQHPGALRAGGLQLFHRDQVALGPRTGEDLDPEPRRPRHGRSVLRLQPAGWNMGFDEFYSKLFTGPSGEPVWFCDCHSPHKSDRPADGPGRAGFTYAKFLRRLVHRC